MVSQNEGTLFDCCLLAATWFVCFLNSPLTAERGPSARLFWMSSLLHLSVFPRIFVLCAVATLYNVHLLAFIWATRPAPFHFAFITCTTIISVTFVSSRISALLIWSVNLMSCIFLYFALCLVLNLFVCEFARDHVWHPYYVIAGRSTYWLNTFDFRLVMVGGIDLRIFFISSEYFPASS